MKCMICNKEVIPTKEYTAKKDRWFINSAIIGEYINVEGHKECCENVNRLVVIPNRIRIIHIRK